MTFNRCTALASVLIAGMAGSVAAAPTDTPPTFVAISSGATQDTVGKAVRLALVQRAWTIEIESANEVSAAITRRNESARIRVVYTADGATIFFVDGKSVFQKDRDSDPITYPLRPEIYQGWVANLAKDIPKIVQRVAILGGEPVQSGQPDEKSGQDNRAQSDASACDDDAPPQDSKPKNTIRLCVRKKRTLTVP